MSIFIQVNIDGNLCLGLNECGKCLTVCPVNIFEKKDNMPVTVAENLDECTFCDRCLEECKPGAITIEKLYEK